MNFFQTRSSSEVHLIFLILYLEAIEPIFWGANNGKSSRNEANLKNILTEYKIHLW